MFKTRSFLFAALCVALGIVLPMAFHWIPQGGIIFSPMHIPVLLAGLLTGPMLGLITGLITPILSSLITGMPPTFILPGMTVELAVYGFAAGLFMQIFSRQHLVPRVYASLLLAMLIGRIAGGIFQGIFFGLPIQAWVSMYFVTTLPGIITHIISVPLVYFALYKAGLTTEPTRTS